MTRTPLFVSLRLLPSPRPPSFGVEHRHLDLRAVGEIARRLRLRQPQVSKHLRVLNEAGLVAIAGTFSTLLPPDYRQ